MKKLFTIVAMAMMTIGASAQEPEPPVTDAMKLIAEKDWTEGTEEDIAWWGYLEDTIILPELVDEGLALTNPTVQAQIWTPQTCVLVDFPLERNHDYIARLTLKVPSDGTYQVSLGSWDARELHEAPVTASDDFQIVDVEFPNLVQHAEFNNLEYCHVLLQYGWVVGTTILQKVQVYEIINGGTSAIKAMKPPKAGDAIYNLAGQKVDTSYKGVVIQNGRKFFRK